MGVRCKGASPSDVAVAGGIESVAAFGEGPAGASVEFAEGEEIGGDVLLGAGEAFFCDGELVHEGETEVLFFRGEVDLEEPAAELVGGFPTDLAAKAGFIAGTTDGGQMLEEIEEDGFEKVPIFGADSEERAEPKFCAFGFIDIESSEISFA